MSNNPLKRAREVKNDEFYTQYEDVERYFENHFKRNPDFLRDKNVYCPCDDYEKSQFVKYFLINFERFGLLSLTSTSYAYSLEEKPDLFNEKESKRGKILHLKRNEDLQYGLLEGDGDFNSKECLDILEKSDVIATNPPFSVFRSFFDKVKGKQLHLIAPLTAATYASVFPWIKNRTYQIQGGLSSIFSTPSGEKFHLGSSVWISSDIIEPPLLSLTHDRKEFPRMDNYDAIEVKRIKEIPDYDGLIGVPITFLFKWNSSQFELVRLVHDAKINGKVLFRRILIRRKNPHDKTILYRK